MTNRSSKIAQVRHKHFPRAACMAHVVLYQEPLCGQLRWRGTRLCKQHLIQIAEIAPRQQKQPLSAEDSLTTKLYHAERQRADTLQAEVTRLRAEVEELTALPIQERRRRAKGTGDGTVYALLSGYNVKIGWTGRPLQDRLREYPPSTQLLAHFPAKRGEETRIKRKFAHLRTHGDEWFPYAPQVTEWVQQMVKEHGAPSPDLTCGPAAYETPRPHSTAKPAPRVRMAPRHIA